MGRLTKKQFPFYWASTPAISFTQGTPASTDLRPLLYNPQNRAVAYSVASGSLPTGVTLTGSLVSYNGSGAVASAVVTFRASGSGYTVDTGSSSVGITATVGNTPPYWLVADGYDLGQFTTTGGSVSIASLAHDDENDPFTFTRTGGTAPGNVTVSADGLVTIPAGLTASSYTVVVDLQPAVTTAEADWLARSQGAGVVWAHDFRYAAEVSAFMGSNNGTELVPVQDADGPTGYSLKYTNPAGLPNTTANWGRILSPVYAGQNGLPYDDPAAGGTITRRNWTAGSKAQASWRYGWWGHSTYHTAFPSWEGVGNAAWDGSEFYLQFRVKISASRWSAANAAQVQGSKLWFLDAAGWLANQQMVGYLDIHGAGSTPRYWYATSPFRQYLNRGSAGIGAIQGQMTNPQGAFNGDLIESSSYPACTISGATTAQGACWEWPADTWVTVMLHVKPGRHNDYSALYALYGTDNGQVRTWLTTTAPYRETVVEAFAALPGATSWTTLYSNSVAVMVYGDYNTDTWGMGGNFGTTGKPLPGFNQFAPTSYSNTPDGAAPPVDEYSFRFTQIIFSTQPIACPQS